MLAWSRLKGRKQVFFLTLSAEFMFLPSGDIIFSINTIICSTDIVKTICLQYALSRNINMME